MKKISGLLMLSAILFSGCENYYENQLGTNSDITDVRTMNYVMQSADYATVAGMESNIALALQQDEDSTCYNALLAVSSEKRFSSAAPADLFIPAFIANKYPQLSVGSMVNVTYQQAKDMSAYLSDFGSVSAYTLTEEDYAEVWGTKVSASYLTPATLSEIPSILRTNMTAPVEGDIAVVNYYYDELEPSIGGGSGVTLVDESLTMDTIDYERLIEYVGLHKDSAYMDTRYTPITAEYYFGAASYYLNVNNKISTWKSYYDPEALYTALTDDEMYTLMAERLAWGFMNVVLPARYPTPADGTYTVNFKRYADATTDEKMEFTCTGGVFAFASCSYATISGTESFAAPTLKAATVGANAAAIYVYGGSAWTLYSTSAAEVVTLPEAVYASLGTSYLKEPEATIPVFLAQYYPYALADQIYGVLYKTASSFDIVEYVYDGAQWTKTVDEETAVLTFALASEWGANMDLYLSETFADSRQGDFTIQDIALDGLSYVWIPTATYGMKASAYLSGNKAAESWLISPSLNFKNATQPELSFDQASRYAASFVDECFIMVSTDYKGDVTACTWTHIPFNKDENDAYIVPDGSDWTFYSTGVIDLSQFCGEKITIAFKYTSSANAACTWEVKNVLVQEHPEE